MVASGVDPDAPINVIDVPDGLDAPLMTWTVPVRVPELSTSGDDFGPSLFANQLRIYVASNMVASNMVGGFRIYYGSRGSTTQPFSAITPASELDLAGDEYDPEVSGTGLELHYAVDAAPRGLRQTTRMATGVPWTVPPTVVAGLTDRQGPSLAVSDKRMVVSLRGIGGIEEYGRATTTDTWALLRTHATLDKLTFPGLSADGLEIYGTHSGTKHLYRATRATLDDPFSVPQQVLFGGPIDNREIYDAELTIDGRTMYLAIKDDTGVDIYVTTR